MTDGELSAADYKEIKARNEPLIARLEREKKGIAQVDATSCNTSPKPPTY